MLYELEMMLENRQKMLSALNERLNNSKEQTKTDEITLDILNLTKVIDGLQYTIKSHKKFLGGK